MTSTNIALRATATEFASRKLKALTITSCLVLVALLTIGAWIITKNSWWWFFEGLFIAAGLVFILLYIVARRVLRAFKPTQTPRQKQAVEAFANKLERVSENLQTPKFIIVYRILRDIVRPQATNYLETIALDTKSLKSDFLKLCKEFE